VHFPGRHCPKPSEPRNKAIYKKETNCKAMRRLTAYVSGTVQKTGYRAQVLIMASVFGLKGYVQNLPDGRVKVIAEGDESDLERFLNALKIRDSLIDVQSIEAGYSAATGEYVGFEKMVARGETDQRLDRAADLLKDLIVVNKDVVRELKATREDLRDEIKATREELGNEIKATRKELGNEIKATRDVLRDEIRSTREELRDGIKATHEEVKGVREELKDLREELKGVRVDVKSVHKAIEATGEVLAEKIDGAKEEIAGEIRDLRSELRDDLKERLVRMEEDVSQIKARIGL
jgi:acylphosphatase/gas vesicle protein